MNYPEWKSKNWKQTSEPRVLGYVRTSTMRQNDTKRQVEGLDKVEKEFNLNFVDILNDKDGKKSKWASRTKILEIIKRMENHEFDILWLDTFERLAGGGVMRDLIHKFRHSDCEIFTCKDLDNHEVSCWITEDKLNSRLIEEAERAYTTDLKKSNYSLDMVPILARYGRSPGGDAPFFCDSVVTMEPDYEIFQNWREDFESDRSFQAEREVYRWRRISATEKLIIYSDGRKDKIIVKPNKIEKMQDNMSCYLRPSADNARIEAILWLHEFFYNHEISYRGLAEEWNRRGFPNLYGVPMVAAKIKRYLKCGAVMGLPGYSKVSGQTMQHFVNGVRCRKDYRILEEGEKKQQTYFKKDKKDWIFPEKALWEAYLAQDIWDSNQAKIDGRTAENKNKLIKNRKYPNVPRNSRTYLSGLIFHEDCNKPMRVYHTFFACRLFYEHSPSRDKCKRCNLSLMGLEKMIGIYLDEAKIEVPAGDTQLNVPKKLLDEFNDNERNLQDSILQLEQYAIDNLSVFVDNYNKNVVENADRVSHEYQKDGSFNPPAIEEIQPVIKIKLNEMYKILFELNKPEIEAELIGVKEEIKRLGKYLISKDIPINAFQEAKIETERLETQRLILEGKMVNKISEQDSYWSKLGKLNQDMNEAKDLFNSRLSDSSKLRFRAILNKYLEKIVVNDTKVKFVPTGVNKYERTFNKKEFEDMVRSDGHKKRTLKNYSDEEFKGIGLKVVEQNYKSHPAKSRRKQHSVKELITIGKRKVDGNRKNY